MRLVRYLHTKDKGARHFVEHGFSEVSAQDDAGRKELVVYAGAMLRPAVEETLTDFERREGVSVTRVYNGCGILVAQMKAGARPDVYFACDPRFMADVQDRFEAPKTMSNNQLVIAFQKGNPNGIRELRDLAKPGLRVGVGHEQQCALGALTKETFLRTGIYAAVQKNIVVQLPTGDFLINQLRSGAKSFKAALDVAVVYRSNVTPFEDELAAIPITGIPCAAPQQPIAVSKTAGDPELAGRLLRALESAESRQRFEALGFGWERKDKGITDEHR
jgi:molybdate transport system substrate-binding protein